MRELIYYTKNQLLSFMGQYCEQETNTLNESSRGPGAIDFWNMIQNDSQDFFIQRNATPPIIIPTVIICGPYMLKNAGENTTQCVLWINLLIHHGFKVILWQGNDVLPDSMITCNSLATYLDQRHLSKVSDPATVIQQLKQHHCEPSQYFIIDCMVEQALLIESSFLNGHMNRYALTIPAAKNYRLTKFDLETTRDAIGSRYNDVKVSLDLKYRPLDLLKFIQFFPLVTKLSIRNVSSIFDLEIVTDGLVHLDELTLLDTENLPSMSSLNENAIQQLNIELDNDILLDLNSFKKLKKLSLTIGTNYEPYSSKDYFNLENVPDTLTSCEVINRLSSESLTENQSLIPENIASKIEYLHLDLAENEFNSCKAIKYPCPFLKEIFCSYFTKFKDDRDPNQFPNFSKLHFKSFTELSAPLEYNSTPALSHKKYFPFDRYVNNKISENLVVSQLDTRQEISIQFGNPTLHLKKLSIYLFEEANNFIETLLIPFLKQRCLSHLELNGHGEFKPNQDLVTVLEQQSQLYSLQITGAKIENLNITNFLNLVELHLSSISQLTIKNIPKLLYFHCGISTLCDLSQLNARQLYFLYMGGIGSSKIVFSNYPGLTELHIDYDISQNSIISLVSLPRLSSFRNFMKNQLIIEDCPKLDPNNLTGEPQFAISNDEPCSVLFTNDEPQTLRLDNARETTDVITRDGPISCVILDSKNNPIDTDYIRHTTFENLEFDSEDLEITLYQKPFNYDDSVHFPPASPDAEIYSCYLSIEWPDMDDAFFVIPTYKEFQVVLGLSTTDVICRYETHQQQWHLFPKEDWIGKKQVLCVALTKKEKPQIIKLQPETGNEILLYDLKYLLEQENNQHRPQLDYLFNGSIDKIERLNLFMNYFHEFEDKPLNPEPETDFEHLVSRLYGKAGVCRHIAYIFFVIATALNLKVRYVDNGIHAFVDLALFYDDETFMWESLPVSGYGKRKNMEVQNAKQHRQFFETLTRIRLSDKQAIVLAAQNYLSQLGISCAASDEQIRHKLTLHGLPYTGEMQLVIQSLRKRILAQDPNFEIYSNLFTEFASSRTLFELSQLTEADLQKPILVVMEHAQKPMALNRLLSEYWRKTHLNLNDYLYIDEPSDLKSYFFSRQLISSQLISTPGPLQKIIASSNSMLVINWSRFSSRQIAEYTSLLRKNNYINTLRSQPISSSCRIIMMTTQPHNLSDPFFQLSRVYTIDNAWYKKLKKALPILPTTPQLDAGMMNVNCYQDPSRLSSSLNGEVSCVDGCLNIAISPLEQSISQSIQFILMNPPNTSSWETIWNRIKIENRLYVLNRFIETDNLSLISLTNLDEAIPANLTINKQSDQIMIDEHGFLLNSQTADLLFKKQTSNNQNLLTIASGLLIDETITHLYLTENIENMVWLPIKDSIAQCKQQITLTVLPGGKLGNLQENSDILKAELYDNASSRKIIVSDDCHAAAAHLSDQLKLKTVLRIYVNLNTRYADLISEIGGMIDQGRCLIYQNSSEVVNELIKGSTILLIGEISNELYLQIQSAFCTPAHLWINGQRIEFAGELYLITEQAHKLSPYPARGEWRTSPARSGSKKRAHDSFDENAQDRNPKQQRKNNPANHDDDNDDDNDHAETNLFLPLTMRSPVTVLYGEPGVGKTHQVKQLEKNPHICVYEPQDQIIAWLVAADDGKEHFLKLDEINTYPVGTWDFLYGLVDGTNTVFFQRQWYPKISIAKKVLGTMNPNNHPGRFLHPFIEKHAEKIIIHAMAKNVLIEKIIWPLLNDIDLANKLVTIHELARQISPETGFSIRDLKAFCHRASLASGHSLLQMAHLQYALPMIKEQQKTAFIDQLSILFNTEFTGYPCSPLKEVVVTETRQALVHLIQTNMQLRQRDANLKSHILCEGPSASGKFSIITAILEQEFGLTLNHSDPNKCYYSVNAKSAECQDVLRRAAAEGVPVVLTKANYCSCPALLAQLLDGHEQVTAGFMVLATQTPTDNDSDTTSQAFSSRYHCIYLKSLNEDELRECAEKRGIASPDVFVDCYSKAHQKSPYTINPHLFFELTASGLRQPQRPNLDPNNQVAQIQLAMS